jgi:hypothetical protein
LSWSEKVMQVNNPTLKKYFDEQLVLVSSFVDGKLICEWKSREVVNNKKNSSTNQLQTII